MKSSSSPFLFPPTLVSSILVLLLMVTMFGMQPKNTSYSPSSMFVVYASNHPPPASTTASSPPSTNNSARTGSTTSSTSCGGDDATTTAASAADSCQIKEQKRRGGIGRVFDWGLAKLENIFNDGVLISDLISAFLAKCDELFAIMIHSIRDMFASYETLRTKEIERLSQFDVEFKDLVKLRHKIERKCLHSNNLSSEDQSLCVDRGMEIRDKIQKLRRQRTKSAESIKRFEDMLKWCASYNNWFC